MATPHQPPDPWEHEYAIRKLTDAVETLHEQSQVNAEQARKNHDEIVEMKARVAIYASLIGAAAATAISALLKFIK